MSTARDPTSTAREATSSAREPGSNECANTAIEKRAIDKRLAWIERGAVLLLLAAALVPRVRELTATFGRDFGGHQGAFFATAAVSYERFGVLRFAGYPALALDGPSLGSDDLVGVRGDDRVLLYVNHPPLAFLLAWSSIALFAPEGWSEAWRAHRAPRGTEIPERLPFLALNLVALVAFWWATREAYGARVALLALAVLAYLPVSVLYGPLANLEGPSLAFACAGLGFHARYARRERARDLAATAACFALATCFTYAPMFWAAALALAHAVGRRWRSAVAVALACGAAASVPLALHAFLVHASGAEREQLFARVGVLFEPLVDGSRPLGEWIAVQARHASELSTIPVLAAALVGIAWRWRLDRSLSSASRDGSAPRDAPASRATSIDLATTASPIALAMPATPIDLATPATLGGLAYLFAFYRHTLEEQPMFLLYLAPGVALGAALALDALADPLARLRAGLAPLVVATSSLLLPALVRTEELSRARSGRGPSDDAALATGPSTPLPETSGKEIATLLPPDRIGVHPGCAPLDLAAAFYAWRTLTPIRGIEDVARLRARLPALRDRPASLIVPLHPSTACSAELVAPAASSTPSESETGRAWRAIELP